MYQAKEMFDIFDLFFGVGSIASSGFFYFIYKIVKERQAKFRNSTSYDGVVIEINNRAYPVVEYERNGKTIQFTSGINAPGAKVGQRIDLELSPNGVARIKSNGHAAIQIGLLLTSIAFLVAGCIFLLKRFA
jgi:hypothetical protein